MSDTLEEIKEEKADLVNMRRNLIGTKNLIEKRILVLTDRENNFNKKAIDKV